MSKVIESPVKAYPGNVTIPDHLTMPQAIAFEDALSEARALCPASDPSDSDEVKAEKERETQRIATSKKYYMKLLPGICACVEKWNLEGLGDLTPETFPATPKGVWIELASWLIDNIIKLYIETEEIPNE